MAIEQAPHLNQPNGTIIVKGLLYTILAKVHMNKEAYSLFCLAKLNNV